MSVTKWVVPVKSHWKHSQQGTGAGGTKSVVVCEFPGLHGEQERVLAQLQLPAVSAVLDQKEWAQPVLGPEPQQHPVRWCCLCRAGDVVPPLLCPSRFLGP